MINTGTKAQDALEKRVDALEKIVKRLPTISGLINLRYQDLYYQESALRSGNWNTFDIRRARLDFKGNFSAFDYRLQLELAGSPKVLDAYLVWKALPCLNVQAGEFKVPFSLENPYSPTALETIDNSLIISRMVGYNDFAGVNANGRDIGLAVNGGFLERNGSPVITYNIGIFNGSGINTTDNNKAKDFSGILTVNPLNGVTLSGSYYHGALPPQAGDSYRRRRVGFGARYADDRWLFRGEYIAGKTRSQRSEGYYLVGAYNICNGLQALLKHEYLKQNMDVDNSGLAYYTIGGNYSPVKNLRLMLNYSYRVTGDATETLYLSAQIMVSF
jgi:hypothetical protein